MPASFYDGVEACVPFELMVIEIVQTVTVGIVALALGVPIIRLVARRLENRSAVPPKAISGMTERLERIERAVDTMAIEVERISEGQRFTTKLLAERVEPGRRSDSAGSGR